MTFTDRTTDSYSPAGPGYVILSIGCFSIPVGKPGKSWNTHRQPKKFLSTVRSAISTFGGFLFYRKNFFATESCLPSTSQLLMQKF
jgi:hypothetical protein